MSEAERVTAIEGAVRTILGAIGTCHPLVLPRVTLTCLHVSRYHAFTGLVWITCTVLHLHMRPDVRNKCNEHTQLCKVANSC